MAKKILKKLLFGRKRKVKIIKVPKEKTLSKEQISKILMERKKRTEEKVAIRKIK